MIKNSDNFAFNQTNISTVAQIGISVEPLDQINQQTPSIGPSVENFAAFTLKTAENLVNFVTSYAKNIPGTAEAVVPVSAIQQVRMPLSLIIFSLSIVSHPYSGTRTTYVSSRLIPTSGRAEF